ncbi:hypothetical protein PoB_002381000 [Plakobranchus ocellatus]|uniref:Uncharacterized protein n=1 Tax=Plakobranchus ocellatus TaxID=259542 RepID=A0AAV3ZQ84_9GAST|nr:hypothetical protein PoB_002381000 [Plakobranchus ocellatus]
MRRVKGPFLLPRQHFISASCLAGQGGESSKWELTNRGGEIGKDEEDDDDDDDDDVDEEENKKKKRGKKENEAEEGKGDKGQ